MKIRKAQIADAVKADGVKPNSVKYLGGGSFGRAFKVDVGGKTLVVKAFLRDGLCAKEAAELKVLREHCPVKVPEVYFIRQKADGAPFEYFGMELLEGRNSFTNFALLFKSRKQKQRFADAVCDALIELHSHTSPKFGDISAPQYDAWQDYYYPYAQKVMQRAEKLFATRRLKKYIYTAAKALWAKYDYIFGDEVKEACLIHGDMNVMNIMTKKPFELVGFIDPLNSMYADREYELFQLQNLTGNAFKLYETYKSKYPVSPKCDIKCAFYALFHEIDCYIRNGSYSGFIMRSAVKRAKAQLKALNRQLREAA